ncbi:hypothetical protein METSCH_D06720 [Metschnikowia aff. pulcherrima]|uniref:Uncharacterized protein n=1 Tax=Metschnikowia aff. pulcherrima TaxID=2163413 RepID=A0A4P6XUJ5_9ASCO|nr:hypothetical protein METSCH_D06720 [Metschnikowia aff. pulcherrima]
MRPMHAVVSNAKKKAKKLAPAGGPKNLYKLGVANPFPPLFSLSSTDLPTTSPSLTMQFSAVAILAAVASAASTITETDSFSTLVTITSCESTVTDCPARHSTSSNWTTTASVSSYEGAANKQYAAGAVALAAGALLAL